MFYLTGFTGNVCDNALVFTPDGGTLASGGTDNHVHLWDLAGRRLRKTLRGHTDGVDGLCHIPGTSLLASGSWDDTVRVWDHAAGKRIQTFRLGTSICALDASPDGRTLAAGGGDGSGSLLALWDTSRWQKQTTRRQHADQIGVVRFTPDGARLITGAADRRVGVWDAARPQDGVLVAGHTGWVQGLDVHGRTLAVAAGRRVRLYELPEGGRPEPIQALDGYRGTALTVAFSPSGRLLATGDRDGCVRIWDLAEGRFTGVYRWKIGAVHAVCFSPDGMTAAGGGVGRIVVWDVD